ncbi:MAG: hypothetical protein MR606_05400, partial [Mollicutes bacterium]|nr:hypothetical protein [Mollicutes bacterium]
MITYIDDTNREQYNSLFAKALVDLKDEKPNAHIDSLETYFTYIEDLIKIKKDKNTTYGRKYSILP